MFSTRLNFGKNSVWNYFNEFLRKISKAFFHNQIFYLPYLRNGWSSWCETKRKWVNWMLHMFTFDLDLWPWIFKVKLYLGNGTSRSNLEFTISQPKMVRLPRNKNQPYWLNARPQMTSSGLTLAMTLTLNFQGQILNLLYLSQKWSDCHKTKSKHIN